MGRKFSLLAVQYILEIQSKSRQAPVASEISFHCRKKISVDKKCLLTLAKRCLEERLTTMSYDKEKHLGYTRKELSSVSKCSPRFRCPHCLSLNWENKTLFHTTPTRLWKAQTVCKSCRKLSRWLIDPDLTIALQPDEMHKPMGQSNSEEG